MYDKEKINSLAAEYIKTGSDKVFGQLLLVLIPMIDAVLGRHEKYEYFWEDVKQDVLVVLWKRRKQELKPEKLKRNEPSVFFFFRIRDRVRWYLHKMKKLYGLSHRDILFDFEHTLLSFIQNEFLDPEDIYIVKCETPRLMLEQCKEAIEKHPGLKTKREKRVVLRATKKMIEDDFGVKL